MNDLLVEPLERVGAPDLAPVLLGEVQERQRVVSGGIHDWHSGGELLAQYLGDPLPVRAHLIRGLDQEYRFHAGCHVLAGLWDVAEKVAHEVHPAPMPGAALEHALDRRRQPQVSIRDHQPRSAEPELLCVPRIRRQHHQLRHTQQIPVSVYSFGSLQEVAGKANLAAAAPYQHLLIEIGPLLLAAIVF